MIGLAINIVLIIIPLLIKLLPSPSVFNFLSTVLTIALLLFGTGYYFSIPLFLRLKQGNQLSVSQIFSISVHTTKRLLIPFIVLILLLALGIIFMIVLIIAIKQDPQTITNFLKSFQTTWSLTYFVVMGILGLIFSVYTFTPVYFTVENLGFFKSLKKSFTFALKNTKFFLIVLIVTMLVNFVSEGFTFLITNSDLLLLVRALVLNFTAYGTLISAYLYHQDFKHASD